MRQSKTRRRIAAVIAGLAVIALPAAAIAGTLFDDVDDDNVHVDGITFMHDSGVTVGCGDGTVYCPNDAVTRAQMGTFMHRLSGNDSGTDPSVNADRVDGLESAELRSGVAAVASNAFDALTGGIEVIESVELTAPADGYVIVTGSTNTWAQHTNGTADIGRYGVSDSPTAFDIGKEFVMPDSAASGFYEFGWSEARVYPVAAGAHTFYLLGEETSGNIGPSFPTLTALFVPAAYGAVSTP